MSEAQPSRVDVWSLRLRKVEGGIQCPARYPQGKGPMLIDHETWNTQVVERAAPLRLQRDEVIREGRWDKEIGERKVEAARSLHPGDLPIIENLYLRSRDNQRDSRQRLKSIGP